MKNIYVFLGCLLTMGIKFIYVTSSGKILDTVEDLDRVLNPLGIGNLPEEMLCNIIDYITGWDRFNFGLTCKLHRCLCFDKKYSPKDFLINAGFTDVTRRASFSKEVALWVKAILGLCPLPIYQKYALYDYQIKAILFMRNREKKKHYGVSGGIIQMKMGLGKSIVALSHILTSKRPSCKEKAGSKGFPTLIVASKTVMKEWKNEGVKKFFGNRIKVLYIHKDYLSLSEYRSMNRQTIVKYDLVITTYDVVRVVGKTRGFVEEVKERGDVHSRQKGNVVKIHVKQRNQANKPSVMGPGVIFGTPWERVICDESQVFANPKTSIFTTMMAIYGRYKWCLTGTPIQNKGRDIWAQLRFCGYSKIQMARDWDYKGKKMKDHALGEVILQMDYKETGVKLPQKIEKNVDIALENKEKEIYDQAHTDGVKVFKGMLAQKFDYTKVLVMLTRLRQCCIAPYLVLNKTKVGLSYDEDTKWLLDKDGEAGIRSKKMTTIMNTLKSIPKDEKVLVFSAFTSALDLLNYGCSKLIPDLKVLQVDGSISGLDRERIFTEFKTNPEARALFMSYKVGAEGLNLTQANHIICIEPWWNQALHKQAVARSWRPGQNKTTYVYNPLIADSIETEMVKICKEKEKIVESFLSNTYEVSGLDVRTMGRILGVYS